MILSIIAIVGLIILGFILLVIFLEAIYTHAFIYITIALLMASAFVGAGFLLGRL
jgi:hypothetical protein